jgi:hypothetical protein
MPSGLFPSGFPNKMFYEFLISHMRATCPADLILLDLSYKESCAKVVKEIFYVLTLT